MARVASELASQAGLKSRVHDGPVFELDTGKQRPADWLEQDADPVKFRGGICRDITIVGGGEVGPQHGRPGQGK